MLRAEFLANWASVTSNGTRRHSHQDCQNTMALFKELHLDAPVKSIPSLVLFLLVALLRPFPCDITQPIVHPNALYKTVTISWRPSPAAVPAIMLAPPSVSLLRKCPLEEEEAESVCSLNSHRQIATGEDVLWVDALLHGAEHLQARA